MATSRRGLLVLQRKRGPKLTAAWSGGSDSRGRSAPAVEVDSRRCRLSGILPTIPNLGSNTSLKTSLSRSGVKSQVDCVRVGDNPGVRDLQSTLPSQGGSIWHNRRIPDRSAKSFGGQASRCRIEQNYSSFYQDPSHGACLNERYRQRLRRLGRRSRSQQNVYDTK